MNMTQAPCSPTPPRTIRTLRFAAVALLISACSLPASAACGGTPSTPAVLLKLDDLVGAAAGKNAEGVSPKWERVTRFLEENKIPASYGIIGESLEPANEAYFAWLKERTTAGLIEFWNHGYRFKFTPNPALGEKGEFNGTTAEAQAQSIGRTQQLAKERIGVALRGFGPHSSAVDASTFTQLDGFPEIRYAWFYGPVDQATHQATVVKRPTELEVPIFHPNFDAFLKTFNKRDRSLGYIALQGHPNEWDDKGFDAFMQIVLWLKNQGSPFCRPSDVFSESSSSADQSTSIGAVA